MLGFLKERVRCAIIECLRGTDQKSGQRDWDWGGA